MDYAEAFPYSYDCYVQIILSGRELDFNGLRELLSRNKEKDRLLGKVPKVYPSPRKVHKDFIEKAIKDSYDLAVELGIKNPVVAVSNNYNVSYERVRQVKKIKPKLF